MLEEDFYKSEGELTLKKGLLLAECSEAAGDNTLIYLNEVINALKDITESNIDMVFSYNEKAKDQKYENSLFKKLTKIYYIKLY